MSLKFSLKSKAGAALAALVMIAAVSACETVSAQAESHPSLAGTWALVAADRQNPDGTRTHDYGDPPEGRLMIDAQGRYSIQIFAAERPNFAANDKAHGTPDEYRQAILGSSIHYGDINVDWSAHTLHVNMVDSVYPNWRGAAQVRPFELNGDVLSYRVPPGADGTIAISVWRREH